MKYQYTLALGTHAKIIRDSSLRRESSLLWGEDQRAHGISGRYGPSYSGVFDRDARQVYGGDNGGIMVSEKSYHVQQLVKRCTKSSRGNKG